MGGMSLIMFALIGIAWGLMPTDPSRYRWGRKGRVVVALAGPLVNVALAVLALTALAFWVQSTRWHKSLVGLAVSGVRR